jgi:hypothetical protein
MDGTIGSVSLNGNVSLSAAVIKNTHCNLKVVISLERFTVSHHTNNITSKRQRERLSAMIRDFFLQ